MATATALRSTETGPDARPVVDYRRRLFVRMVLVAAAHPRWTVDELIGHLTGPSVGLNETDIHICLGALNLTLAGEWQRAVDFAVTHPDMFVIFPRS